MKSNRMKRALAVLLTMALLASSTVIAAASGVPMMIEPYVLESTDSQVIYADGEIYPFEITDMAIKAELYADGKMVVYDDASPEIIYGGSGKVTYVPLKKTIEAFGGTVEFDPSTDMITAECKDIAVSFKIFDTKATVEDMVTGQSHTYEMTPAPKYDMGRVLTGQELLSDCFGLLVSSGYDTISVVDIDEIMSGFEGSFTVLDKMIELSSAQTDYKSSGTYEGEVNASLPEWTGFSQDMRLPFSGEYSGKVSDKAMAGDITLRAELDEVVKALPDEIKNDPMIPMIASALQNIEFSYIFSVDDDVMYIKCPLFTTYVLGMSKAEWVKIDLEAIGMDGSMSVYNNKDLTFTELMEMIIRLQAETSYVDYDMVNSMMHVSKVFYGDQNFTNEGTEAEPVYKMSLTKEDLAGFIAKIAESTQEPVSTDYILDEIDELDFNLDISLAVRNDGSYTCDIDFDLQYSANDTMIKMDVMGSTSFPGKSTFDMMLDIDIPGMYSVGFKLKGDSTYTLGGGTIADKPPAGASVVDLTGL